jgi:hypothetical protein
MRLFFFFIFAVWAPGALADSPPSTQVTATFDPVSPSVDLTPLVALTLGANDYYVSLFKDPRCIQRLSPQQRTIPYAVVHIPITVAPGSRTSVYALVENASHSALCTSLLGTYTNVSHIDWTIGILALDNVDLTNDVSIPVNEAIAFIQDRSLFRITFQIIVSSGPHTYTNYTCGQNTCVVVNKWDVDTSVLPVSDSFLFLWKLFGRLPLQAGSTWGVADGIMSGGISRPYATIPTDIWWYNLQPYEGFATRSGQINTHELVNAINAKLEVAPYNCTSLTATPGEPASVYEAERLSHLTTECYDKLIRR